MSDQSDMSIKSIDQRFSITGQISLNDLEKIAHSGFKTVVNFRPDGEGGDAQPTSAALAAKAAALGLAYAYIPVIPNQIQPGQVAALGAAFGQHPQPVLGFCRTGNRAQTVYQQLLQTTPLSGSTAHPACCHAQVHQTGWAAGLLKFFKK
ncbi:TIGR01244 family sulfur transferase [Methylophilus aquaticus]|uniref:TIGR01244 family sulfur transferase n=1 Tax=Methylophilus aquaticus TaxID=1971610 RepID=A0ABT9JSQ6_9PROT|nr:TIGR01244 family sulfur transferase [Methylophilus aquaticus]MDP8567592.1 TIGR01244 family sulfur transferase [Methylophilus aquaticus]